MVELLASRSQAGLHSTIQHFGRAFVDDCSWFTDRHVPFRLQNPCSCSLSGFETSGLAVVPCGVGAMYAVPAHFAVLLSRSGMPSESWATAVQQHASALWCPVSIRIAENCF